MGWGRQNKQWTEFHQLSIIPNYLNGGKKLVRAGWRIKKTIVSRAVLFIILFSIGRKEEKMKIDKFNRNGTKMVVE